jgi:hypothetical protein
VHFPLNGYVLRVHKKLIHKLIAMLRQEITRTVTAALLVLLFTASLLSSEAIAYDKDDPESPQLTERTEITDRDETIRSCSAVLGTDIECEWDPSPCFVAYGIVFLGNATISGGDGDGPQEEEDNSDGGMVI